MGGMRWTEEELKSNQQRTNAKVSASFGAGLNLDKKTQTKKNTSNESNDKKNDEIIKTQGKENKKIKPALERSRLVSETVRTATVSGHYEEGRSLELLFDGAQMLSTNDMYALTHYQRIEYRNAWHDAIDLAVLQIIGAKAGQIARIKPLTRFKITTIRQSKVMCDTDALQGLYKYPIDGLRYAKIIMDDNPNHFISMESIQKKGPYLMGIKVEAIGEMEFFKSKSMNFIE